MESNVTSHRLKKIGRTSEVSLLVAPLPNAASRRSADKNMKINHTLLLVLICIAAGCTKTSNTLEGLGEITSPGKICRIELTEENPGLKIHWKYRTEDGKGNVSRSPSEWENHAGSFAYVDPEDRVWAFNGKDKVYILEILEDGSSNKLSLETWGKEIPMYVDSKIPDQMKSKLANMK